MGKYVLHAISRQVFENIPNFMENSDKVWKIHSNFKLNTTLTNKMLSNSNT